jgi:hypothetical protein
MANNLIQIKRSLNTASPGSLANGELAYTANGDVLFIGSNNTLVPIGGKRDPGILSANQALVTNSTSWLNSGKFANLVIEKVYANGSHGTAGHLLVSGGSASNSYYVDPTTVQTYVGGSNTEIQFNDEGTSNGSSAFAFDKTTNVVSVLTMLQVAGSVTLGETYITVGNSTINTYANSTFFRANNATIANASITKIYANSAFGTDNQVLHSNSTGGLYWSAAGDITEVVAGDGLTGGGSTGSVTVDVGAGNGIEVNATSVAVKANNGIVSNSTGVFVKAGDGIASNATGVHVVAGTGVVSNATGVYIGQAVGTTDNVTFNNLTTNGNTIIGSSLTDVVTFNASVNSHILPSANITHSIGNNTLRFLEVHAQNVHSEYLYVDSDVTISGNLIVSGNLVTVNVSTLAVTDSLIQLASNNTLSDALDIGFFGSYQTGGGDHEHTGLFRDASDDTYKLFKGLTPSPTTTVDTSNNTYQTATLQAYLNSGGLVTNATHVALTANSTVNVSITANSLTLSSPLAGGSGGTGLSTVANNSILVANSTNGYSALALGSDGYVLQSNGTTVVYATLDGGTF